MSKLNMLVKKRLAFKTAFVYNRDKKLLNKSN